MKDTRIEVEFLITAKTISSSLIRPFPTKAFSFIRPDFWYTKTVKYY